MQRVVLLGLVLMAVTPDAAAEPEPEPASLLDVLRESTASIDLRYRYEWVRDDAVGLDAHASTLRTALGYETGAYEGFAVFLEAENVSSVGAALYDNAGVAHLGNRRFDRLRFVAPWRQTIAIKAALYDADGHATDVAKLMLWSAVRF